MLDLSNGRIIIHEIIFHADTLEWHIIPNSSSSFRMLIKTQPFLAYVMAITYPQFARDIEACRTRSMLTDW